MFINFGKKFSKRLDKAEIKIRNTVDKRIRLFAQDPFNPFLNNHQLTGVYKGYRSINITGDWRALYLEEIAPSGEVTVTFEILGTHSELYG